jgi:hypothetical protein
LEDPVGHRAGRAILKTILEGKLKPYGIQIEEGYRYRKVLSFVPDFVFSLPTGKVAAIDYITGVLKETKAMPAISQNAWLATENSVLLLSALSIKNGLPMNLA